MKIIIYVLMIMVLSSCSRQCNRAPDSQIINIRMYINAPDGLYVWDTPGLDGDRIALLDDLTPVLVIKEDKENIPLNENDGKWTFIVSGNAVGWVLGGYLSSSKPQRPEQHDATITEPAVDTLDTWLLPLCFERQRALFERSKELAKDNIESIGEYIYNDLNLRFRYDANGFEELLAIMNFPEEYRIVWESSFVGLHAYAGTVYVYLIETGLYRPYVWTFEGRDVFFLAGIGIKLSEDNYLHLFPFNTFDEFMAADTFGTILRYETDMIQYKFSPGRSDSDTWSLIFRDGLLDSIWFAHYIP